MNHILLIVAAALICPVAAADVVTVSGQMLDQATQRPAAGVEVGLIKLVGTWKFWTLPEHVLVASASTDASGFFILSGDVQRYYVVEVDTKGCMTPYKKVFDLKEHGNRASNLEIVVGTTRCDKSKAR